MSNAAKTRRPVSEHERARRLEVRRRRKVARLLIDAGYRALARRSHPDVGGSHEAMLRLTVVRDTLRDAVVSGHRRWSIRLF
jgi:hypothetical protein